MTVLFEKVFGPLKTLVLVAKKSRGISKPDFFDLSISLVRIPAASTVQTGPGYIDRMGRIDQPSTSISASGLWMG